MGFNEKKINIRSNQSTFSVRNFMRSHPVFIFRSPEHFFYFFLTVAPERVHLKPQWTGIPIQFVSVTPVDWGTYATTMNELCTLDERKLSTGYPFGPF